MKVKPTKFDALATVLYTENEVLPSTVQNLREDSFRTPASGYSPEDWMKLPYRKRRYITLRDRARSVSPGAAPQDPSDDVADDTPADVVIPDLEVDVTELPPVNIGGDEDDLAGYGDVSSDPIPTRPVTRTNAYGEVITNFVSGNAGATRDDIAEYLASNFGDRLNTTDEIQDAIAQAVGNGDISFDDNDVAHVGELEDNPDAPSDADINVPVKTDADKARERAALAKKFLAWRKAKNAGLLDRDDSDDEEDESDEEDDENPTDRADRVIGTGRGLGRRLSRAGVEFDD